MKVRTTIAGTPLRARLAVLCWGALTLLAPVAVSACTSGSSPTTPTVSTFTPSVTSSGTATAPASPSSGTTSTSTTTASGTSGVSSPTVTVTVTETTTPQATSTSEIPTAAPVTGGGGTAGLQDALLFGLGAAAILVGAGSIVYRRRLTRHR